MPQYLVLKLTWDQTKLWELDLKLKTPTVYNVFWYPNTVDRPGKNSYPSMHLSLVIKVLLHMSCWIKGITTESWTFTIIKLSDRRIFFFQKLKSFCDSRFKNIIYNTQRNLVGIGKILLQPQNLLVTRCPSTASFSTSCLQVE